MPANLVVLPSLSFLPTFPSLFCFYLLKPPTCFFFFPCSFSVVCFPFFILLIFFLKPPERTFTCVHFFPITPCFLPPDLAVLPSSYLPPRLPVCSACSCGYVPVGAGPCTGAEAPASTMCPVLTCIIPLGTLLSIKK